MLYTRITILFSAFLFLSTVHSELVAQCNTDVTICEEGEVAGPFDFVDKGPEPETSCLAWGVGEGGAYIVLYITETGPLNIVITGNNAPTGCLDVAIFDIPTGEDPCDAIYDLNNEIACNFISPCEGCAEFGYEINDCAAQVDAPWVEAGDVIFILVQDYSSAQDNFTMQLAPPGQGAQTGPPDPTITPVDPLCDDDPALQLTAANMGGTWTGPGTTADGVFDPATAGIGTHTIDYSIGQPPCDAQDQTTIEVIDCSVPQCFMTNLDITIEPCVPEADVYTLSGTVEFEDPPAGGTLIIEDAATGANQVFNAPFTSPTNFSFDIPSTGANTTVTAYFSDDLACSLSIDYTAPDVDDAGTVTATVNGQSTNDFILCEGDEIVINSNGDVNLPDGADPGLNYGIYTCPPTQTSDPDSDPCYTGFVLPQNPNMTDENINGSDGGILGFLIDQGLPVDDNQLWFAPITMVDAGNSMLNPNCTNVGEPTLVTYLEPLNFEAVQDCENSVWSVTLEGGHPEFFGGNYTLSNLTPANANFSTTDVSHGETVNIEGLEEGDVFDFEVTDGNGCTMIVTGGPYNCCNVDAGTVTATVNGQSNTDFILCNQDIIEINSNGDVALPSGDNPGITYAIYFCEPTTGLVDPATDPCYSGFVTGTTPDMTDINDEGSDGGLLGALIANGVPVQDNQLWFAPMTMTDTDALTYDPTCVHVGEFTLVEYLEPLEFETETTHNSCFGDEEGTISFTNVDGGTGSYTYSVDGGTTFSNDPVFENLATGTYDLVLQDDNGCSITGQATITEPNELEIFPNNTDVTCPDGCDAAISAAAGGGTPPYTWNWSDNIGNPDDFQVDGVCEGDYTVIVIDNNDCVVDANFTITEPDAFVVQTDSEPSNCNQPDGNAEVTQVTGGNGGYTYQWDANANNQTGETATNLTPGDYEVTITDQEGCETTEVITVGNIPGAELTLVSTELTLCHGSCDGQATVEANGGDAPYTYTWSNGEATGTANQLCAGEHTVEVEDANGCTDEINVTIEEPSPVTISVSPDTTICIDGTATLIANGDGGTPGYTYNWSHGLGTGSIQNDSPATDQVYTVSVIDANGCESDTEFITVNLAPPLDVIVIGPGTGICVGHSATISAFGFGGQEPYTYTWTNDNDPTWTETGGTINYTITEPITFTVILTDDCGSPAATDEVEVTILPDPEPDFTILDPGDCAPFEATFANTTPQSMMNGYCAWDFGDGNSGFGCETVSHVYTEPGCYDVTLTVTSPDGCTASFTRNQIVCAHPYPDADFVYTPVDIDIYDAQAFFQNTTVGGISYEWDFAGLGSSEAQHPQFTFPQDEEGQYQVCMVATNEYSCTDTICKYVFVKGEFLIYVPNSFTPDGDGINDEFYPVLTSIEIRDFEFHIYNRWGELIFESYHPENRWDGRVRGKLAQQDVYVWRIKLRDSIEGKVHEFTGHVTLLK